jgi:hypothetical protein
MENTFIKFLKDQRKRFASVVSKYTVTEHRILRTEVASLLIAYDQAVDFVEDKNKELSELTDELNNWGTEICEIYHTQSSFYTIEYQWFLQKMLESLQKNERALCFHQMDLAVKRPYELKQSVKEAGLIGFVAKIKLPIYYNVHFGKNGEVISSSANMSDQTGQVKYEYIFSTTIEGLWGKAIEASKRNRKKAIENARKELKTTGA